MTLRTVQWAMACPLAIAACFVTPANAGEIGGGPAFALSCPIAGGSRTMDLSTGTARWIATGPGLPVAGPPLPRLELEGGRQLASVVDPASLPGDWTARLAGAQWIQAVAANRAAKHPVGTFNFVLQFEVKPGGPPMKLKIDGQFAAEERFQFDLEEPAPPNSSIGSGASGQYEGKPNQDIVSTFSFDKSSDGAGKGPLTKPLGSRPGLYSLIFSVDNSANSPELALLAQVKLTQTCGGSAVPRPVKRRR